MISIENRPLVYSDVIGQHYAKKILSRIRLTKDYDRAYRFSGPHGVGKTTLARIFARSILCEHVSPEDGSPCNTCRSCLMHIRDVHPSYIEVDAASSSGKEDIEALKEKLSYENPDGVTIILLDECHRISATGKDALLKTLEAGGAEVNYIFIFCTTEPRKMPRTIWSRGTALPIRSPSVSEITGRLAWLCTHKGITFEPEALTELAVASEGHVRDAEQALRTASLLGDITLETVRLTTTVDSVTIARGLCSLGRNLKEALDAFDEVLQVSGPEQAYSGILQMLVDALRTGMDPVHRNEKTLSAEIWRKLSKKTTSLIDYIVSRQVLGTPSLFRADIVVMHTRIMTGDIRDLVVQEYNGPSEPVGQAVLATASVAQDPTKGSDDPWVRSEEIKGYRAELRRKNAAQGAQVTGKAAKLAGLRAETTNATSNELLRK